jgi:DNA polymerase III epsilon subunit family exonuclease
MRSGVLRRRLLWGVLAMFVVPTLVFDLARVALYWRGVFSDARTLLLGVLIGLAALMGYLGWVAYALGASIVRTVEALRHGAELMVTVNPAYRIAIRTGDELEALAHDVNQLADDLRQARLDVEAGSESARAPERSELADFSLLDEMEPHVPATARERQLGQLTFVVLDAETTGLRAEAGDRIVSLAGVRVRSGIVQRTEVFDALVCPERPIPAVSTRWHGITDAMVASAPTIDVVLPAFLRFAEGALLAGHEISFDLSFLGRDIERLGLPRLTLAHPILDTRLLSRLIHGPEADHTIEAMAHRLGVTVIGRHSALGDALTTAEILVRLLDLLARRGVATLGQLLDALSRSRTRR